MSEETLLGETLTEGVAEANPLADLIGEGKKYASIEEAAIALAKKATHADQHIETLLKEKREVEAKLQTAATMDDLLKRIDEGYRPMPDNSTQEPSQSINLEEEFNKFLSAKEQANLKKSNQEKFWTTLSNDLGSKEDAKKLVDALIKENPARKELIASLGVSSPDDAVLFVKSFNKQTTQFSEGGTRQSPQGTASVNLHKLWKEDPLNFAKKINIVTRGTK